MWVFDELKIRKIAEERRRLEVISNLLREGVILVDTDGRVCLMNQTALNFFSLSQGDVEGRPLKDIPMDERFRNALLRSVESQERLHDQVISLLPSDSLTQAHRLALSTAFVRDENGDIMSIAGVFRTVSGEDGKREVSNEGVNEVVEELAERLRTALHVKDDKEGKET